MRKKEEFESARLMDFEFRRRARATRALAENLGLDPAFAAECVATLDEAATLDCLAELAGVPSATVRAAYTRFVAAAHAQLTAERGDPSPHRLA